MYTGWGRTVLVHNELIMTVLSLIEIPNQPQPLYFVYNELWIIPKWHLKGDRGRFWKMFVCLVGRLCYNVPHSKGLYIRTILLKRVCHPYFSLSSITELVIIEFISYCHPYFQGNSKYKNWNSQDYCTAFLPTSIPYWKHINPSLNFVF